MKYVLILILSYLSLIANDAFISATQLKSSLNDEKLIIIDASDFKIYKKSHIKGAIHADISSFIDKKSSYSLMSSPKIVEEEIQALGINSNSYVVIYAHNTKDGILNSSYLAYILTSHGFENISILDGGYMSWVFQNEFLTSTEISKPQNDGNFVATEHNDFFIDAKTLQNELTSSTILDARSPEAYYGVVRSQNIDEAGHITKAKSAFYLYNFLTDSSLRPQKELNEIYIDGYESTQNNDIIVYSDNIFSASMEFYILYNHMGFKNTKLYEAGLLEWSKDLKLPMTRFKWE